MIWRWCKRLLSLVKHIRSNDRDSSAGINELLKAQLGALASEVDLMSSAPASSYIFFTFFT